MVFALVFNIISGLYAQTITEEEVTVIAPYSPSLLKAQKISLLPAIENNFESKLKLDYYTNPKLISTTFELEQLKSAQYKSPDSPKSKQNFLKAGMGLYTTPYVEAFFNGKVNKNLLIGVQAKHLSSKASIKDFASSAYSTNKLEVWGKNTGMNTVFWIEGQYKRDAFHYYGFNPADFLGLSSIMPDFDEISSQLFSNIGLKFSLLSKDDKVKNSFKVDGSVLNFWDKYGNNEAKFELNGAFRKPIQIFKLKNEFLGFGINTEITATNWENNTQPTTEETLKAGFNDIPQQFLNKSAILNAYYKIEHNRFDLKIGGAFSTRVNADFIANIYPDVNFNINVVNNIFDLYGKIDGGLLSPSYYSISRENPYVSSFVPLKYTNRQYRVIAGLKANVLGKADFHLWGSTEKLQDDVFFTSNSRTLYGNQFTLLFDDVELIKFGGDLHTTIKNFEFNISAVYQAYTLKSLTNAWYKPKWIGHFSANYLLFDNLEFNISAYAQSAVKAKVGQEIYTLGSIIDFDAGLNYHFNKSFSAFASVNNLLSPNYQMWYNYPVKGFGAIIGLAYLF